MADAVKAKKYIRLSDYAAKLPRLDDVQVQVLIAVLVGVITLVLLLRLLRRGVKRRGVLLMGLCESGKTQLFSRICHGADVISTTSMKTSQAELKVGKKSLTVFDVPGHERIRYGAFEKVKGQAGGVAFVVDSATIQKDVRDAAEFLYILLSDDALKGVRVLVVCNKQDLPLARAPNLIQKMMEKEINLVRETKTSQLRSTNESGEEKAFLGRPGEEFEFSHIATKVEFVEAVSKGGENVDNINTWLQHLA